MGRLRNYLAHYINFISSKKERVGALSVTTPTANDTVNDLDFPLHMPGDIVPNLLSLIKLVTKHINDFFGSIFQLIMAQDYFCVIHICTRSQGPVTDNYLVVTTAYY